MNLQRRKSSGQRFEAWVRSRVARRGAFPFLVSSVLILALGAGVVARATNPDDFGSYGDGIWWALVTLTTVGYGDVVPSSADGRLIGAFVMLLGVTFISFLTANVTSLYIKSQEDEREAARADSEADLRATLHAIEARLDAIESRLPTNSKG